MSNEDMARSILLIPGMADLLLKQMGISPPQNNQPSNDVPKERGRSVLRTPPSSSAPRGSSSTRTNRHQDLSPKESSTSSKSKTSERPKNPNATGSNTRIQRRVGQGDTPSPSTSRSPSRPRPKAADSTRGRNASPKRPSKAKPAPAANPKKSGSSKKRKQSSSPDSEPEQHEPDEYDLAYSSYQEGTAGKRGTRVLYTTKDGETRVRRTKLEAQGTRAAKEEYVNKHGHPYSSRVGFNFNPYVRELAEGDYKRIPRPQGEMGRSFKAYLIAGWKTDYDEFLNYSDDLRKALTKLQPQDVDVAEDAKITWSHYGNSVRRRLYSKMEEKRPFLKCFRDKTGENNWFVRDTAQMYLSQSNTYNNMRNKKHRGNFMRRNQSGSKALQDDDEELSDDEDGAKGSGAVGGSDDDGYDGNDKAGSDYDTEPRTSSSRTVPSSSNSTSREARRADKIAAEEEARAERMKQDELAAKKGKGKATAPTKAKAPAAGKAKGTAETKKRRNVIETDSEPEEEPALSPELQAIRNSIAPDTTNKPAKTTQAQRQILEVVIPKSPAPAKSPNKCTAQSPNKRKTAAEDKEEPAPKKAKTSKAKPASELEPDAGKAPEAKAEAEQAPKQWKRPPMLPKRDLTPEVEADKGPEEVEPLDFDKEREEVERLERELAEKKKRMSKRARPATTAQRDKPEPVATNQRTRPQPAPSSTPAPEARDDTAYEPTSEPESKIDELADDSSIANLPVQAEDRRPGSALKGKGEPMYTSDGLRIKSATKTLVKKHPQPTRSGLRSAAKKA